jgi:opacity protein-like surface antigen
MSRTGKKGSNRHAADAGQQQESSMRKPLQILALALVAAAPSLAAAANDPWSAPFSIQIGAFDAKASTTARLDGTGGRLGTSVSFEGDLGLDDTKALPAFDWTWRFNQRHALEGSIVSLHRDGTRTLNGSINWGDNTYPVSTSVNSKFDSDIVRVAYRYSFVNTPNGEFAVLVGLHWTSVEAGISNAAGSLSKSASVDYPLPTIGLRGSARLGDNWRVAGFAQLLKIKIGDYDGELYNFGGGVEWAFNPSMYAGLGYDYYKFNVVSTKDVTRAEFDYKFDGPKLYFGWSF